MNVKIAEAAWQAKDQIRSVVRADDVIPNQYMFMVKGRSDVIAAVVVDGNEFISLHPERSAAHSVLKSIIAP